MTGAPAGAERAFAGWLAPIAAFLLAAWLGATIYFTVIVTRAAFAVLPSRTLSGALVGQILPILFDVGILVGIVLVGAALAMSVGGTRTITLSGGVAIIVLAALARFVILARITRLRVALAVPIDSLPVGDPVRRSFGQLHAMSVGALGLAMLVGIVVAVALAHLFSTYGHD
jgi:Domain of unknown function (DUF4149)